MNIHTTTSSPKYLIVQAIDSTILLFLVITAALTDEWFKLVSWFYRSIKIATSYPPNLLKCTAALSNW